MWQYLRHRFFSALYYLGKAPPTAAEIAATLHELEQQPSISGNDALCDCQVMAGGKTIDCQPGIKTYACELIGEKRPGTHSIPLPLGGCKNLPREGQ
jgi:hypothetical protein